VSLSAKRTEEKQREVKGYMIESLGKEKRSTRAEGLTLEELEGQTVELLPNRLEMHRHRRRVINIITINDCFNATAPASIAGPINAQCS
jgi:hypothetical protein